MAEHALVKAELGDGRVVQVEVRTEGDPEADVGIQDVLSFDGVVDSIEAITKKVTSALRSAAPDRATVEFGVDIGVEAGGLTALIVKGSGTATLKITLEWESNAQPAAGHG
jgi:hypothetical protein